MSAWARVLGYVVEFAARRLLARGIDGEAEVADRLARAREREAARRRIQKRKTGEPDDGSQGGTT